MTNAWVDIEFIYLPQSGITRLFYDGALLLETRLADPALAFRFEAKYRPGAGIGEPIYISNFRIEANTP